MSTLQMLIRLLLLGSFAAAIFLPVRQYDWLIGLLFIFMLALVGLYYMLSYWVSLKKARDFIADASALRFTAFTARSLKDSEGSSVERGRIVITDSRLLFLVKYGRHDIRKTVDIPVSAVTGFSVDQVMLVKRGLIISYLPYAVDTGRQNESDEDEGDNGLENWENQKNWENQENREEKLFFALINADKREGELKKALSWE